MNPIIAAAAGIILGAGAGYILFLRVLTGKRDSLIREAELKGESIKEKKILQAKEKFIELKEKQANQRKDSTANSMSERNASSELSPICNAP